jgi:hypothetical protein
VSVQSLIADAAGQGVLQADHETVSIAVICRVIPTSIGDPVGVGGGVDREVVDGEVDAIVLVVIKGMTRKRGVIAAEDALPGTGSAVAVPGNEIEVIILTGLVVIEDRCVVSAARIRRIQKGIGTWLLKADGSCPACCNTLFIR